MTSSGCAEGPDGHLLDASEITWYNDPNDSEPLPTTSRTTRASPVPKTAGSRCPKRTLQPSAQLRDPENTAMQSSRLKHKPDGDTSARKTKRPAAIVSSGDEASEDTNDKTKLTNQDAKDTMTEGNCETDAADNDASNYEVMKAMGDA